MLKALIGLGVTGVPGATRSSFAGELDDTSYSTCFSFLWLGDGGALSCRSGRSFCMFWSVIEVATLDFGVERSVSSGFGWIISIMKAWLAQK